MKTLYILRHAKAVAEDREDDAERPLAKRGRKAAAAMGDYLAASRPAPQLVLCSTARRTRETLDQILPALSPSPEVIYEEGLYLAAARRLHERLQRLPEHAERVLLIGHNPGLHQLASSLASDSSAFADGFPTAALAVLRLSGRWDALRPHQARLLDYQTPKSLNRETDSDSD
ncbi:MAG TPA: histidine phosphatase family protein [Stellaceae bacterium]|nr:histidine phosphatase family protein [Stellaceae bacterium]